MDFLSIFKTTLGQPDDEKKLVKYINFVIEASCENSNCYTEKHHLLPRSKFPEFANTPENMFNLKYDDHIKAHILLREAYILRSFQHPLNFMLLDKEKNGQMISELNKKEWKKFKNTEKYDKWRKERSEQMSIKMRNGMASKLSNRYWSKSDSKEESSKKMKETWKEKREYIVKRMREERGTEEHRMKMSLCTKKKWDNMSADDRLKFNQKMKEICSSDEYRNKMSIKVKEAMNKPETKEKMKNRKFTKSTTRSETMKEKWKNPEYLSKMKDRNR
jgi:hypothetical protein